MSELPLDREVIVLLAEDDPDIRDMLEKLLKRGGYEMIVASDGQDAIQPNRLAVHKSFHVLPAEQRNVIAESLVISFS